MKICYFVDLDFCSLVFLDNIDKYKIKIFVDKFWFFGKVIFSVWEVVGSCGELDFCFFDSL